MAEDKNEKNEKNKLRSSKMNCVLSGCENEAVARCNNCGLPICSRHGKKVDHAFICSNCSAMLQKMRLR